MYSDGKTYSEEFIIKDKTYRAYWTTRPEDMTAEELCLNNVSIGRTILLNKPYLDLKEGILYYGHEFTVEHLIKVSDIIRTCPDEIKWTVDYFADYGTHGIDCDTEITSEFLEQFTDYYNLDEIFDADTLTVAMLRLFAEKTYDDGSPTLTAEWASHMLDMVRTGYSADFTGIDFEAWCPNNFRINKHGEWHISVCTSMNPVLSLNAPKLLDVYEQARYIVDPHTDDTDFIMWEAKDYVDTLEDRMWWYVLKVQLEEFYTDCGHWHEVDTDYLGGVDDSAFTDDESFYINYIADSLSEIMPDTAANFNLTTIEWD